MSKVPLTAQGAEALREELKRLKAQRPEISAAIAAAREHGDLRENAEYHAAKEQQGLAEARIRDIESKLSNAQIIEVSTLNAGGKVVFGATVNLVDADAGTLIGGDPQRVFSQAKYAGWSIILVWQSSTQTVRRDVVLYDGFLRLDETLSALERS